MPSKVSDARSARRLARRRRYALREHLRTITGLGVKARIKACGRRACTSRGGVEVYITQDRAGGTTSASYSGVQSCTSVWACPCCAPVICERRAEEIDRGLRTWLDAGHGAAFVTLTLSHHRGDGLSELLDDVAGSFTSMLSGRSGKQLRIDLGIAGTIRVVEITHSDLNGWHPHIHVVVLFDRAFEEGMTSIEEAISGRLLLEWQTAVASTGRAAVVDAFDCQLLTSAGDVARYVVKVADPSALGGIAREMTAGHAKIGRGRSSRTPFAIAADHQVDGDPRDLALWQEYERCTRGRRRVTFSHGLRALLGLGAERTDEELLLEDPATKVLLTVIAAGTWYWLSRTEGGAVGFLERVERGLPAALAWLDAQIASITPEQLRAFTAPPGAPPGAPVAV